MLKILGGPLMSEENTPSNSDLNILIVDDEENLGNMLVMVLKAKGYTAESCVSSIEALKKIRSFKYQLIISDIKMPDMHGIDLLKEIRKVSTFIQVIMITGYSSLEVALECMDAGAVDFLFKPFEDLQEVYDAVASCGRKIRRWRKIAMKAGKISRLDKFDILK